MGIVIVPKLSINGLKELFKFKFARALKGAKLIYPSLMLSKIIFASISSSKIK